jgi:hypothetical protein
VKNKKTGLQFGLWFGVFFLCTLICYLSLFYTLPNHVQAAPGTNQQLNFQGRLFDSTGAVVADGLYNIEYKIYQDGTGCVAGGASPCGGTLKWTESRTLTNRVTVTNGYLSVNLGSVNAFGGSVDWNQDTLWLSVNIGGTANTASPTWDGEMTPFKRLTSTPYALNSSALQGLAATSFVQLATGVQNDTSTANPSIFVNKNNASLAPNILQLQKAGNDVLTVNNSGQATLQPSADGNAFVVKNRSAGKEILTVDTTGNQVILGKAGTGNINGTLVFNTATASSFTVSVQSSGTTTASYSLTLPTALPGSTQCLLGDNAGVLSFASCAATPAFSAVGAGTNANALVIGTGGSLSTSGTGTITATGLSCSACVSLTTETTGNYVGSVGTSTGLIGGAAGSQGAALTLSIDQTAGLTWTGNETFNGAFVATPSTTNNFVVNGDNDSNVQINSTFSGTGPSQTGLAVVITDNATAAGTSYGLSVTNADNAANVGVPAALAYLKNANAAETVTDGLLVEQTGAGTLTNGLEIKRTAGTIANGLTFTGTIGSELKLQNAETISNGTNGTIALGADAGAVTLSLSGTAATVSNTAGGLSITGAAGLTLASSANNNIAINPNGTGDLVITQAAGSGTQITASAVPTVDQLAISNAGQGVTIAGINGLSINYVGGAAAVEASGARIDLTGGTTAGAGAIWNGLRIVQGTITAGTTIQDIKLETAALTTTSGATVINGLNLPTVGAISSSTAGSITWNGLSLTNANLTQGAGGAATANSLALNLGTITTAGTQTGLLFNNITAVTAGQTTGLYFGSGGSTSWTDLHSSTAASNNVANVTITKSATGANANTFTVKNDATTMNNLFEVRDLSANTNQFGGLTLSDAFVSRQSYYGQEFNIIKGTAGTGCADAAITAAATNVAQRRGDGYAGAAASGGAAITGCAAGIGELTTSSISSGTNNGQRCDYFSNNAVNSYETIRATGTGTRTAGCLETNGTTVAATQHAIFNSANLPQVVMKVRTSVLNSSTNAFYAGVSNRATLAASIPIAATDKGLYFSNCSNPITPVCNAGGGKWYGYVQDGTTNPPTSVTCPASDSDGTAGMSTTAFSYLRIEIRKATTATNTAGDIEAQFFIDYDVSNGIHETSCGTITQVNNFGTAVGMGSLLSAYSGTATASNLDVDYFRVWQDDAPFDATTTASTPVNHQSTAVASSDTPSDAAPLTVVASGGPDPKSTNTLINFMAATDQDASFSNNVYVKGTLYADKIVANQIEGIEVLTDKVSSLQAQISAAKTTAAGSVPPPPTPIVSLTSLKDVQVVSLTSLAQIESKGGLQVDKDAQFNGKTLFQLLAQFNGPVKFNGAVSYNNDAGGTAVVKKDAQHVEITFSKEYATTPMITSNYLFNDTDPLLAQAFQKRLLDAGYTYIVTQVNTKGFEILLNRPATEDISFNWLATLINNPQISQSKPIAPTNP